MAMTEIRRLISDYVKKYRYAAIVVLAGIVLMILPEKRTLPSESTSTQPSENTELQELLSELLSQVNGAGKVEVLLTQEQGEQILYQTDDNSTPDSTRKNTVLISGTAREEEGLIRQINPPTYRGAVVLCQGADNAAVRLVLVEAVKSVTGLTTDRITVLKMK